MSEINCNCGYNYTKTGCPNCKHVPIDYTEKYEQAIANMQREYDKRGERIKELEGQLQSVLDRETSILRYYDAKLDAADAQLKTAVWALTDIGDGEPEWPDEPQRELDWCRDRANRTLAKIKGEQP